MDRGCWRDVGLVLVMVSERLVTMELLIQLLPGMPVWGGHLA